MKQYKIIYADPAWIYDDKSISHGGGAESHYNCSSLEEMAKIIEKIQIHPDAVCLMWVTYPQLPAGLKLMEMWGFEFKTVAFTWIKLNKSGIGYFFGMGRYTRGNPEICLLGKRGQGIKRICHHVTNIQIHKLREHSRKPDAIRNEIVKLFGDLPRIEIFSRHRLEGWDVIGDQAPDEMQEVLKCH